MRRYRWISLIAVSLVALAAWAGGAGATPAAPAGDVASPEDFGPDIFDADSATLHNPWLAFEVGKRFIWTGSDLEDGERTPHRIVMTVTDLTKVIAGVHVRVGWERDFSAGHLVENELIMLAEDKAGNIWHLGQYSEAWEEGQFVGGSAWFVGSVEGAHAGIMMHAEPRLGTPPYSEGFAPAPYYWDDVGQVYKTGQKTCVPVGCFKNVVVIDESEPGKPGAHQLKYYARGIGSVRTGWRGSDPDHEELVLAKILHLDGEALARARAKALELETRAYVYGSTPPAELPPSAREEVSP